MVDHVRAWYVHNLSVNYVSRVHLYVGAERSGRVPRSVLIIRKLFAGRHVGLSRELELVATTV